MLKSLSERHKEKQHEGWLNRRAYRRHLGSEQSVALFRSWRGIPDLCGCGCGKVEYSKSDPANWWQTLTPKLLWETGFLLPLFGSLYGVLGALLAILWGTFLRSFSRKGFKAKVTLSPLGNKMGSVLLPVRLLIWSIICLVLFFLCGFACLGGVVLIPLYIASLALVVTLLLLIWMFATLYIASHGILFLIGGAASIFYLSNPVVGISLIAVGVALEYERNRRRDRNHREEVGRLLRIVEEHKGADGARKPQAS